MEITEEVLDKMEEQLWEDLAGLNKSEEEFIEQRNGTYFSQNCFLSSLKSIINIRLLRDLKEILDDNEISKNYYDLKEFETKENDKELVENGVTLKYNSVYPLGDERVSLLFDDILPLILSHDDLIELIADLKLSGAISLDDLLDELLEKYDEIDE